MKVLQKLNRFYVNDMDAALAFYEELLNQKCTVRFCYAEAGLELAQVADILILAGSDEALTPFCETKATFVVDAIAEFKDHLMNNGAVIIRDLKQVPTGVNMTVRHADGTIIEYVEMINR